MPMRSSLVVGSADDCDIVLNGGGVMPRHAQLSWRDGLVVQDLGAGQTMVDGRVLGPTESVVLPGFHASVMLGAVPLLLSLPALCQLFVERSALAGDGNTVIVGRDPARAHVLVAHPTVSGVHAQIDITGGRLTDLGSRSGTFDRNGQRLTAHEPQPLDRDGGYFFGLAWVATSVLADTGRVSAAVPGAGSSAPVLTALPSHDPVASPDATALVSAPRPVVAAPPPGTSVARPRTMLGTFDLGALPELGTTRRAAVIGRHPTCDIVLPYPQLSGRHASLTKTTDGTGLLVTDEGSTNGTYVGGVRLGAHQSMRVAPGDRIFLGPYPIIVDFEGETIRASVDNDRADWSANLVEIEALDLFLQVPDREDRQRQKVLLDHVTFKARPGDLIALMGPSGAGKTTLLTMLNGYLRPTSGEVRINGENLYAIYDALRGSIGYVPQDDIVHPELTVWEAIKYSAQFRLPADYTDEEINRRVEQTIRDLGLEAVKDLEIGRPERKVLSGGQRKRVNIALELVTDPALMFLDEPTSGLAADDTVALIDLLSGLAKKTGKTIIVTIHQPAREEYEKFNLALVMGYGGEPLYFGPTGRESYDFFGRYVAARAARIDNPRDMFDLLRVREDDAMASGQFASRPAARLAAAQAWRNDFYRADNATYRKMYSGDRTPGTPGGNRPPARAHVPMLRQFRLLLARYTTVKLRDRVGTMILFLQAPIIGVLLALVFAKSARAPNMWCRLFLERMEIDAVRAGSTVDPQCMHDLGRFPEVADLTGALFFLSVASIWFGTSNAAREIVAELSIYRRERMVNLSVFNYVASKFVLLSGLCIVQCTVLLGIVYPAVGLGGGTWAAFLPMLWMMILTAMCAVAIGLLLSTVVVSAEAAMALTPIALIPQVVLGGRMVPMTNKAWLKPVMALIPARWSFEGVLSAERDVIADSWRIRACVPNGRGVEGGWFDCAFEELRNTHRGRGGLGFATYDFPAVSSGVLIAMTVAMLLLVLVLLQRRDSV